jgi:Predicted metal-dependent protease of the PAD1/JAB1 superfamily
MIRIRQELTEQLVRAATAAAPRECGGVLGGPTADTITTATAVTNVAADPQTRYELEPAGVLAAVGAIEAAGDVHIGFYHSHPRGPARPSRVDRAAAAWPQTVHLICAPTAEPSLAAYRYIDAAVGFERLTLSTVG